MGGSEAGDRQVHAAHHRVHPSPPDGALSVLPGCGEPSRQDPRSRWFVRVRVHGLRAAQHPLLESLRPYTTERGEAKYDGTVMPYAVLALGVYTCLLAPAMTIAEWMGVFQSEMPYPPPLAKAEM